MSIPIVTLLETDRVTVSDETGFTDAILDIEFDIPVAEYKVNVLGVSHDSGVLAHRGVKNVGTMRNYTVVEAKNITVADIRAFTGVLEATVDYTELYQEGNNQVNIYGRSVDTNEWGG